MKTQETLNQIVAELQKQMAKNKVVSSKPMSKETSQFLQKGKTAVLNSLGWKPL